MASEFLDIPYDMRRVYQRFERWRSAHTGRLPIPERLWVAAVELARQHGVFATAKALHLEYGKLKQLADAPVPALKGRVAKAPKERTHVRASGVWKFTAPCWQTAKIAARIISPAPSASGHDECRKVRKIFAGSHAGKGKERCRRETPVNDDGYAYVGFWWDAYSILLEYAP
jgi:hypothetical protein